ncbi:hypothetical protein ACM66B_005148 [Microbotryomycetes sp. NB124-2]
MDADGTIDTPEQWHDRSLQLIDSSLRCAICGELYTAPVMLTNCSHTFCSLCIRQSLQFKKVCPTCNTGSDEGRLRTNMAVDSIVKAWAAARQPLLKLQAAKSTPASRSAVSSKASGKRAQVTPEQSRLAASTSSSSANGHRSSMKKSTRGGDLDTSDIEIVEDVPARTSSRSTRSGKAKKVDLQDPALQVTCPICGGEFTNAGLSMHIDRCNGVKPVSSKWNLLSGRSKKEDRASSSDDDTSKHIARATYSIMNVTALTKLIKEHGLPTTYPAGASSSVKQAVYCARLQRWTTIWNANADLPPGDSRRKTKAQLLSDLAKWEKTSKYENEVDVDSAKAAQTYAKEHESEFQRLTRQARESYRAKRALAEQSITTDPSDVAAANNEAAEGSSMQAAAAPSKAVAIVDGNNDDTAAAISPKPRKSGVRFADNNEAAVDLSDPTVTGAGQQNAVMAPVTGEPVSPSESIPSPPRWLEDVRGSKSATDANAANKRVRAPSPYDPRGPRPSQMVRGVDFDVGDDEEDEKPGTEGD